MTRAALLLVMVAVTSARSGEPDPVRGKLHKALDGYQMEMKAYREKGAAWLEAREKKARAAGNKKALDAVHEEQRVFRTVSDLPKSAPMELRADPAEAKAKLVRAYGEAVKGWTKAGADDGAADAEKRSAAVKVWYDPSLDRQRWVYPKGEYRLIGTGRWVEWLNGRVLEGRFTEIDRTAEYVEIQHTAPGNIKHTIRLTGESNNYRIDPATEFTTRDKGKWAE